MNKFIAVTAIWILASGLGICVMMYGWGVQPVSWGWIIGGSMFGRVIVETLGHISKEQ